MFRFKINYHNYSTELCEIGKKYDTDKSSQRKYITYLRHCYPYTIFYDNLFKNKKDEILNIAELGILKGSSLLMWKEYFINANIYGFDNNNNLINHFIEKYDNDRINLSYIDVFNKESILNTFLKLNIHFDIIIDDTTHNFEDQIRIIENTYQFLKPGGIMIIEDIYKSYIEQEYFDRLQSILHNFQNYYFIELDHVNRNSIGWNNDKLLILIKDGAEPIFNNTNKLTIITPSYRIDNLSKLKESINFNYVDEWIIVYDGNKIKENPYIFKNDETSKIIEYIYKCDEGGISGNSQRNYALNHINNEETLLYYLDDDNIIHPDLYKLLSIIDNSNMYTFDQINRLKGDNLNIDKIDTAMMIIPYKLCKEIRWIKDLYNADGYYINACYEKNKNNHIYVNNDLCYYNYIAKTLVIILGETREYELTFDNFKKNVIDELNADLCLCIGVKPDYNYENPFYKLAKYKYIYNEPNDYGDLFDIAYNTIIKDKSIYDKNTNDIRLHWRILLELKNHIFGGVINEKNHHPGSGGVLIYCRWFLLENLINNDIIDKYDKFIITRSDFIYQLPHPKMHIFHNEYIYIPNSEHYGGYTDRHTILSKNNIIQYLDIFNCFVLKSNDYFNKMKLHQKWNLEQVIKFHLKQHSLINYVKEIPYIMYSVRSENIATRGGIGTFNEKLGYYIKYHSEYNISTMYKLLYENSNITIDEFYLNIDEFL